MIRAEFRKRLYGLLVAATIAAACTAATAFAHASAAPENIGPPHINGIDTAGATLRASTGLWADAPTSYVYKWQRCNSDGTVCSRDLQTGSKNTYTLTPGDVQHTVRVVVTGVNAQGRGDTVPSEASDVVSSKDGPKNTTPPAVTGDATEGQRLTVSTGAWAQTPPTSLAYQWQRCDAAYVNCRNIAGATGTSYTVQTADVGERLRVLVTAKSNHGSTSTYTGHTPFVQSNTPPAQINQAPTLQFLSLIWYGRRVYARFRVCDDGLGRITVVERDTKPGALAYTRRYSVYTYASCGTFSRSWVPAPRFRTRGRTTVTLQAVDKSHKSSALRAKSASRR